MNKVILYRGREFEDNEKSAAESAGFTCIDSRMKIKSGEIIIPRYSFLPYPEELEKDINLVDAKLINSVRTHRWIADIGNWASLEGIKTFRTWDRIEDIPDGTPLVVKGQTNSRKFSWNNLMYAEDREQAIKIYLELSNDSLIGQQKIYFREYIPLVRLTTGLNGLPISKEFRFFICNGVILSGGFYWSSHIEELKEIPSIEEVPLKFLWESIEVISQHANFYALDIAQTEAGEWIIVEINDGCMSGLSENNPTTMYKGLMRSLDDTLLLFSKT